MSWLDIAGLGIDLLGGLMGYDAQKSANEANLQIARENNAWSEKMLDKQIAYNTEMWNKQNEYNDPSAQMARLQAAGLSPYRMMGQGNTGTAGSAQGISLPSPQQTHLEAEKIDLSAAQQRLAQMSEHRHQSQMAAADVALKEEELKGLKIDNAYKERNLIAALNETIARTNSFDAKRKLDEAVTDFEKSSKGLRLGALFRQNELQGAQTALFRVQKLIADKNLKNMDEMHQAQVANIMEDTALKIAQAYQAYESGRTNKMQRSAIYQNLSLIRNNARKALADAVGQEEANKLFNETFAYSVQRAYYNSLPQNTFEEMNNPNKPFWYILPEIGHVVGTLSPIKINIGGKQ